MPDINSNVAYHKLNVDLEDQYVSLKRRHQSLDKVEVTTKIVQGLLDVNFIFESRSTKWFSNIVLVKKLQVNGECVYINKILTGYTLKVPTPCRTYTNWWKI